MDKLTQICSYSKKAKILSKNHSLVFYKNGLSIYELIYDKSDSKKFSSIRLFGTDIDSKVIGPGNNMLIKG